MSRVRYNQRGYIGLSMSARAAAAYDDGEKPKSRWTKKDMVDAIIECCEDNGLTYDPAVESLKKDALFARFFILSSWHHTGKYAQRTDFYSIDEWACKDFFQAVQNVMD